MDKGVRAALQHQYEMLGREVLEIHARSDRLEQFFVVTLGAIYGFALTRPELPGLGGSVFFVPPAIAYFAFIRLELLSRVRSITRKKQIELERALNSGVVQGPVEHFQTTFYGADTPSVERDVGWYTLFNQRVSDRAGFWRLVLIVSTVVAVLLNYSIVSELVRSR